ncbi:MAG: excinuclease ABC subunit UvrC [Thermaurantiacus sp.]
MSDVPPSPDRFLEEAATYTVRAGRPDLEAGTRAIKETRRTLGTGPGVYRMLDERGAVLYVGKARNLKARVTSYTAGLRLPRRLQRMVAQTRGMEVVTTRSESEALLLEAQLIKRFRPPFNVLLRDDKSFPFIALAEGHDFPRLSKHRGARRPRTIYYGPFASAGSVTRTLTALQKLFLLRSCSDRYFANRTRPCLLYQIRRCSAPCVGRIDGNGYAELVADAKAFLSGRSQMVQKKLGNAMEVAAAGKDYELAAVYRDRLRALTFIQGAQAIHAGDSRLDADVIALARRDGLTCIQVFFIRQGQNWGHRALFPAHAGEVEEVEVLAAFLGQFYEELDPPRQILLDRDLPDAGILAEALATRAGRGVDLRVPQRGQLRRLVAQASRNAAEAIDRRLAETGTQARNLRALADFLGLEQAPRRIEIYDNSHIQGSSMLGAMVVADGAGFVKSGYRKFNRKGDFEAGDDFAMMREMLTRRFARLMAEQPEAEERPPDWPDLLLIDGGKGQVSAVARVLDTLGVEDVAILGIAKGPDRNAGREVLHTPDGRERMLPPNDPLLFFLQRLRDEAHRFAIGAHRQKRGRALTTSSLDDVPGIGPARKKALLMHFGTARAVRGASLEDLLKAPGISQATAEALWNHFHARQ